MQFRIGCMLGYDVPEPSIFIFNVAVARCPRQRVLRETLRLTPVLAQEELAIPATGVRYTRIEAPAGRLSLHYEASIELEGEKSGPGVVADTDRNPPEVLPYLFSSRYCQADQLADLARDIAGGLSPGPAQVAAICDWVYSNLHYLPGTSDASTSALDTARGRAGVCRDFAHLAIALCRALGIPARYVTGYAWGLVLPDFHACMETFLAGRWQMFDPSRKVATGRLVRIGTGRDAADASFATIYGAGRPSALTEITVFAEPAVGAGSSSG